MANGAQRLGVLPFGISRLLYHLRVSFHLPFCLTRTRIVCIAERGNGMRKQPIVALMASMLLSLYKT